MDIIYEIEYRFRITNIPCYSLGAGSPVLRIIDCPFLINYRAENAEKAENCQLPNDLFEIMIGSEQPDFIRAMRPYLDQEFAMSDGMLECLLAAPRSLSEVARKNKTFLAERKALFNERKDVSNKKQIESV